MFCQSHSLTFTFAFMFALCLVSGHTVQIIRAFFCFPVNGVLCFCLLLCHVSMLPCCQRRCFSFCSQKMSQFLKVITELSNARWHMYVCGWRNGQNSVEMQLITPEICTFLARLSGGEFSEIALFLIPLPWLHSSFFLPSARPSFIFQLECLITAEPLQVWNNARKIPREKLS